ncbi:hypothetical protein BOX15_Mlig022587g3 [Macrostomum lignano]|uniref:Uncharacterized protein n=2 Tax=Macrostomum lignano TaxID=282301 RepID=A0A267FQM8_9PLAT|nr:hypothetical protein BOX15_Mlig022587g3 [Macrostomum lignano]
MSVNMRRGIKPHGGGGSGGSFHALGSKSGAATVSPAPAAAAGGAPVVVGLAPSGAPQLAGQRRPGAKEASFESNAWPVDPTKLVRSVEQLESRGSTDARAQAEMHLCGALVQLRSCKTRLPPILTVSLAYLAKSRPTSFTRPFIFDGLCSFLRKRDQVSRPAAMLCVGLLTAALRDQDAWPDSILRAFVEDSVGDRFWVDRTDCRWLVRNLEASFPNATPADALFTFGGTRGNATKELPQTHTSVSVAATASDDDSAQSGSSGVQDGQQQQQPAIQPRYAKKPHWLEELVVVCVKDALQKRGQATSSEAAQRAVIRLMTVAAGYSEIRLMAANRLEMWLQLAKLQAEAMDLLTAVCCNCTALAGSRDCEVVSRLVDKLRFKSHKAVFAHYLQCLRMLVSKHPDNLRAVLATVVANELSSGVRNPNNAAVLVALHTHTSKDACRALAAIFRDLLVQDTGRHQLRCLLRDLYRHLKADISLPAFVKSLLLPPDSRVASLPLEHRRQYAESLLDLLCVCQMVSAAQPAVREAVARRRESDEPAPALTRHYATVAKLHRLALHWLAVGLPNLLPKDQLPPSLLGLFARRACFLPVPDPAPPETPPASWDHPADHWPPEQDRQLVLRLCSEVPLHSDTITAALRLGIDRLVQPTFEALNLASDLVFRSAAALVSSDCCPAPAGPDVAQSLFDACIYQQPDDRLLAGGSAFASAPAYWSASLALVFLAAFNPDTLGRLVWDRYPTVRCLLEMVMTCMYEFPCQSLLLREGLSADAVRMRELRALEAEKTGVVRLEMQLAGTDITEASSRLLGWLMDCAPCGPARQPPAWAIDQLRKLNAQYGIGLRLCRSRDPDFLLDLIQVFSRASASQQWLVHLVDNLGNQSLSILPVQCLAEILLAHVGQSTDRRQQLLYRLASLANSAADASEEVLMDVRQLLSYFMIRLRAKSATIRATAADCLALILAPQAQTSSSVVEDSGAEHWLLDRLPRLPLFPRLLEFLAGQLVDCIAQETCPRALGAYIAFLTRHLLESRLANIDRLALAYLNNLAKLVLLRPLTVSRLAASHRPAALLALRAFAASVDRPALLQPWPEEDGEAPLLVRLGKPAGQPVPVSPRLLLSHLLMLSLDLGPDAEPYRSRLIAAWLPDSGGGKRLANGCDSLVMPETVLARLARSADSRLASLAASRTGPPLLARLLSSVSEAWPAGSVSALLARLAELASGPSGSPASWAVGPSAPVPWLRLLQCARRLGLGDDQPGVRLLIQLADGKTAAAATHSSAMEIDSCQPGIFSWTVPAPAAAVGTAKASGVEQHHRASVKPEDLPALVELGRRASRVRVRQLLQRAGSDSSFAAACREQLRRRLLPTSGSSSSASSFAQSLASQQWLAGPLFAKLFPPGHAGRMAKDLADRLPQDSAARQTLLSLLGVDAKSSLLLPSTADPADQSLDELRQLCLSGATGQGQINGAAMDYLCLADPAFPRASDVFAQQSCRQGSANRYVAALLLHRSDLAELPRTVQSVLADADMKLSTDAGLLLDAYQACQRHPRLLLPGDHGSKALPPPPPMRASTAELLRLAQLAVREADSGSPSADQIERRADLICAQLADECAEENVDIADLIAPPSSAGSGGRPSARALVRWLTAASRSSAGARRLRLALYCRLPMLGPPSGESGEQRILQPGDAVLAYGHRVLAGIGSQCESTQAVSATACRVLAARHPRLLPPILPVAAALLSGRYLLPWTEFRWQGPLAMFGCLVQVLEHLGPRLYQSDATRPAVDAILSSYARALHRYRDNARVALIPLGAKLALLLRAYVSAAPRPARRLLASLRPQLTSLPSDLTDSLPELTALTASGGIEDESIDSRLDSDADYQDDVLDFGAAPASGAASAGRHSWSHSLIANCRKRLRQLDNLADLTDALRELEDKTRRRPDLLDSFVGDIERLIGDACPEVRGPALTLLLRQARRGGSDVDSSEHAAAAAAVLRHLQPGADPGARAQLLACLPELASVWPDRSPALLAAVARLAAAGVPDAAKAYGAALDQLNLEALLPGAAAAADSDAAGSDNQQQQQQSGALATADDAPSTSDSASKSAA